MERLRRKRSISVLVGLSIAHTGLCMEHSTPSLLLPPYPTDGADFAQHATRSMAYPDFVVFNFVLPLDPPALLKACVAAVVVGYHMCRCRSGSASAFMSSVVGAREVSMEALCVHWPRPSLSHTPGRCTIGPLLLPTDPPPPLPS